jgi:hypothetical protein
LNPLTFALILCAVIYKSVYRKLINTYMNILNIERYRYSNTPPQSKQEVNEHWDCLWSLGKGWAVDLWWKYPQFDVWRVREGRWLDPGLPFPERSECPSQCVLSVDAELGFLWDKWHWRCRSRPWWPCESDIVTQVKGCATSRIQRPHWQRHDIPLRH